MSSHHDYVDRVVKRHNLEKPFPPENGEPLKFKVGDPVVYTNDYGVSFRRHITGYYQPMGPCSLYATGYRYLLDRDCPWMPAKEASLRLDETRTASATLGKQ